MKTTYYDFDPSDLDDLQDAEDRDDMVTLDNWKPTEKKHTDEIIQSEWRQKTIGINFNQQPGLDELRKIEAYLKKKKADSEIMKTFGIDAETLVAIKKNKYCPINGISLDNLSKIYIEFKTVKESLVKLQRGADYLASILFMSKIDLETYKYFCKHGKTKNKPKKELQVQEYTEEKKLSLTMELTPQEEE